MKDSFSLRDFLQIKYDLLEDVKYQICNHDSNVFITRCDKQLWEGYYPVFDYDTMAFIKRLSEEIETETNKGEIRALLLTIEDQAKEMQDMEVIKVDALLQELDETIKYLQENQITD